MSDESEPHKASGVVEVFVLTRPSTRRVAVLVEANGYTFVILDIACLRPARIARAVPRRCACLVKSCKDRHPRIKDATIEKTTHVFVERKESTKVNVPGLQ